MFEQDLKGSFISEDFGKVGEGRMTSEERIIAGKRIQGMSPTDRLENTGYVSRMTQSGLLWSEHDVLEK